MAIKALLLTIFVSVFFLFGLLVPKWIKNKNAFILFTTGVTFVILLYLCFVDLVPEIIDVFALQETRKYVGIAIIFTMFGFVVVKILDFFIPDHTHEHKEQLDDEVEHQSHLYHIGFITAISLILHNILEGISIYITGLNDFSLGLMMAITVGCHNLPLGMEIRLALDAKKSRRLSNYVLLLLLFSSSFLGAFALFLIGKELGSILEGIFLSVTLGMLLYLLVFEIVPEVLKYKKEKQLKVGIFTGIGIALLLMLL